MEHAMRLKQKSEIVKVSASYLLSITQNELTGAHVRHVRHSLVDRIKLAQYCGIMLDSRPDVSYCNQVPRVIRYVKISNRKVEFKEVFLGLFPLRAKKQQILLLKSCNAYRVMVWI